MDKTLLQYLKTHNITYTTHNHSAVFTVEQSRKIKQNIPGLSTKSLFLKDEHNNYYLVCLPAEKRLSTKKLKMHWNKKELHFATPQELKQELNTTPGSVSLFAVIYAKSTILIIDPEVWNASNVGFHPNINTATLVLTHKNLEKFYNSLTTEKHIISLSE